MLGINEPWDRVPKPYRNYYCANPDDKELKELEALGVVELYSTHGRYDWYRCTDAGKAKAIRSHRTIRYAKSKRVYGKFLDISDCRPDLTFKQFLTSPEFKETRKTA